MKDMIREKATTAFILASLLAVGVVAGSAWSAPQQAEQGFAWKDGAEVYKKVCALCHDTGVAPVVLGRGHDPLFIQLIVRNGSRAMPAFRASEIDDHSLEQLAGYVSKTAADK